MLTIKRTTRFKKDFKAAMKRGHNRALFEFVVGELAEQRPLDAKFNDHPLTGNWLGFRECHIQPDWLLIYLVNNGMLTLTLSRTGTHADLFGK